MSIFIPFINSRPFCLDLNPTPHDSQHGPSTHAEGLQLKEFMQNNDIDSPGPECSPLQMTKKLAPLPRSPVGPHRPRRPRKTGKVIPLSGNGHPRSLSGVESHRQSHKDSAMRSRKKLNGRIDELWDMM